MPTTASPVSRRRLLLVWLWWTIASALGLLLAFLNLMYVLLPQEWILEPGYRPAFYIAIGGARGISLGLAQALVLRHFFRARWWPAWIALSVSAYVAALLLQLFAGWGLWHMQAPSGLLVGLAQVVFLERTFKGRLWWLWPAVCMGAWVLGHLALNAISGDNRYHELGNAAQGAVIGFTTGLALILLLRKSSPEKAAGESLP